MSKLVPNWAHKTPRKARAKTTRCSPTTTTGARRQIGNVKAWAATRSPEVTTRQVADRNEFGGGTFVVFTCIRINSL